VRERNNPKLRTGRLAGIAALAAVGSFFAWQGYCLTVHCESSGCKSPKVGNSPENIAAVSKANPAEPTRFAVVGDWRGTGAFEDIMERLNSLKPDFVVLLGDMTHSATPGDHRFIQMELSDLSLQCPPLYVVGNHDIGPNYPIERWEQEYGPAEFFFRRGGDLFIFCYIWDGDTRTAAGLDFLSSTLAANAAAAGRIFVFNHKPPNVGPDWIAADLPHQQRLLDLLDRYKVNYFISGHYHSYARFERGPTTFLVSGGGGAKLKKQEEYGFYHSVLLTLEDNAVQERLIVSTGGSDWEDDVERRVLAAVLPFIADHPYHLAALDAACCIMAIIVLKMLILHRQPGTAALGPAKA